MTDTKKDTAPSVATVDSHGLLSKILKWEESKRGAPALAAWNEIIAHIDAHVAAQVAQLESQNADLRQALSQALSAQAAAQVSALADVVKYTRLARGIQNPAGDHRNGPWEDFYACDDVVRALSASQPSPAPVAMTDEQALAIVNAMPASDFEPTIAIGEITALFDNDEGEDEEVLDSIKEYAKIVAVRAILAAQQEAV